MYSNGQESSPLEFRDQTWARSQLTNPSDLPCYYDSQNHAPNPIPNTLNIINSFEDIIIVLVS